MQDAIDVVSLGFYASLVASLGTGVGSLATFSLLTGFAVMMYLDAALA